MRRLKNQKYYSAKEIDYIADDQLTNLSRSLYSLVETGAIEEKTADLALDHLKHRKDWLIEMASKNPIWQNPEANCLPIMPVISEKIINVPTLMKMIVNDGKPGRSFVELEKIKSAYEGGTEKSKLFYWVLDVRINESRYNCPALTVAETIAYILHNPTILSEYTLDSGGSRYKKARKKPSST